jgi:hypothetical protein
MFVPDIANAAIMMMPQPPARCDARAGRRADCCARDKAERPEDDGASHGAECSIDRAFLSRKGRWHGDRQQTCHHKLSFAHVPPESYRPKQTREMRLRGGSVT